MTELFLKLLNMGLSATWLILAVLLLRLVLKRAPKWVNPLLWGVAALRLVLPFSIESALSLIPRGEVISPEAVEYAARPAINTNPGSAGPIIYAASDVTPPAGLMTAPEGAAAANPLFTAANIAALVWLIGIALMLLWALASWMGLRSRMSTAVRLEGEVYESEFAASPFVLGVFRPRIYLPYGLDEGERAHILAHERAHIARRDTWFKPLGFLILSLHWYNPLVWLAWTLYCRDVEYACDERAVKNLAAEQRAEYSEALLKCSAPGRRAAACPLAFGESDAKGRVKNVLSYRKPAFWIILAAVALIIVLAVCFLTNPASPGVAPEDVVLPENLGEDFPEGIIAAARDYAAADAKRIAEGGAEVTGAEITQLSPDMNAGSGRLESGESYVLELYMLAWRVEVSGLGDYELTEFELESGGFIKSGDTVWLLFRRSAGADEYIGALRQSGIENGLSAEAQALYEAWLEDNPGGEGAEIFTPEEVAFEAEGTPAAVESAAREYVANEAVYWVESSGGDHDGPVEVASAVVTGVERLPGAALADGELRFYAIDYEITLEPEREFDGNGGPGPSNIGMGEGAGLVMLFRVSGGEWTHIGDMNELNFDLIWERPGVAESYPDKYAAAARLVYDDYLAQNAAEAAGYCAQSRFLLPEGLEAGEFDAALGYAGGWEFEGGFVLSFSTREWGLEWDVELIASLAPPEGALRDAGPLTDRQLEYPAYAGLYTDAEGAEYQTVFLARQMESVGFMLGLDAARYGREDAISFASGFRFPGGAWYEAEDVGCDGPSSAPEYALDAARELTAALLNREAEASGVLPGPAQIVGEAGKIPTVAETEDGQALSFYRFEYRAGNRSAAALALVAEPAGEYIGGCLEAELSADWEVDYGDEYTTAAFNIYADAYVARRGFTAGDVALGEGLEDALEPETLEILRRWAAEEADYWLRLSVLPAPWAESFEIEHPIISSVTATSTGTDGLVFYQPELGFAVDTPDGDFFLFDGAEITGGVLSVTSPCLLIDSRGGGCVLVGEIDAGYAMSAPDEAAEALLGNFGTKGEASPESLAVEAELEALRQSGAADEELVRGTVTDYYRIVSAELYTSGWADYDFSGFFPASLTDYSSLAGDVLWTRECSAFYEQNGVLVVNRETSVSFDAVEINGSAARAEGRVHISFSYPELMGVESGEGFSFSVELQKTDGVWLITDIEAPPRNY